MNIKRIFTALLLIFIGFTLVSCKEVGELDKVVKSLSDIYSEGDSANNVTSNLNLPLSTDLLEGVTITWESSNTNYISHTGLVTRPNDEDKSVDLKVTVTYLKQSLSKDFNLVVKKLAITETDETFILTLKGVGLTANESVDIKAGSEVVLTLDVPADKELDRLLVNSLDVTDKLINNTYKFVINRDSLAEVTYKVEEGVVSEEVTVTLDSNDSKQHLGDMTSQFKVDQTIFKITGDAPAHGVGLFPNEFRLYANATFEVILDSKYTISEIVINNVTSNGINGEITMGSETANLGGETTFSNLAINAFTIKNKDSKQLKFESITVKYSQSGPVVKHNVTFDTMGGSPISPVGATEGSALKLPVPPVKSGFTFDGWYIDADLSESYNLSSKVAEAFTLYAKWIVEVPVVKVTVEIYDGKEFLREQEVIKGSLLNDISTTKSGYKFIGWYKDEVFKQAFDEFAVINENVAIFGKWEESNVNTELGTYYQGLGIENAQGQALRSILEKLVNSNVKLTGYSSTADVLIYADADEDDKSLINIIYENETMTRGQKGSGGPNEWNKEHMVPQSWGVTGAGLKADMHNLRIARASTNSVRGNLKYADGSGGWKTTGGGFYPGDGFQGDSARIVMYMMLRLPKIITASKAVAGNSLEILAKWHHEDPVDSFELNRNQIIFESQGNRNPFIDHPEFFDLIFGSNQNLSMNNYESIMYTATNYGLYA